MRVSVHRVLPFFAPSLAGLLVFFLGPLALGLPFSVWSPARGWLGPGPFLETLQNPMFQTGLANSALFLVLCVPATLGLALGFSLWLNRARSAAKWLQSLLFLPYVLPTVCALFAFRWLLDYGGVVNRLRDLFGLAQVAFLSGAALRGTVLLLFLWKNTGFFVAFLSTRLLSTPRDWIEAARLDGAGPFRRFWAVYLPHLRPTLVFALVLCAVQAMEIFRECYLLAGSYPAPEIYTLQHYIYNRFHSGDYASAAAALYLILPVSAGMVLALLKGEKYAEA